ncbi:hypothetical protein N7495_004740 [Penicillium taxi]|uniref:uncharacterized protein n=1 Tax=Penicillium taxi TaxID=168475 RepID=UPI00254569C2|nr:uncharacterized protein N7495_004740 [Penicillium taxi]KAJ5899996.1 hypothetical protein N7495_004740 [Penicillium taxi]
MAAAGMALPSPPPASYLRSSPPPHETRSIQNRPSNLNFKQSTTESEDAVYHQSPSSPVRIHRGGSIPQTSSAQIENYHGPPTPMLDLPDLNELSLNDQPPKPPQHTWNPQSRHTSGSSWSVVEPQAVYNDIPPVHPEPTKPETSHPPDKQHVSGPESPTPDSLESSSQISEPEPLPYHHQHVEKTQAARMSRLGMNLADGGSTGNLASRARLSRPMSTYSSASDHGNKHNSGSPYLKPRVASRNSTASPDNRMSTLDLMNTSYPQPGPSGSQFNNSALQSSVGNHASLLSHKQTFEMYLTNVKKTDQSGSQYEFAIFMINSIRELPPAKPDDPDPITPARLMKEAKSILQRLADRSYPFAQYYLADGYASGLFNKGKPDLDRGFSLFMAASKHGHIEACYRTALCYEFGWGCRKDGARAEKFYRQAASKNHPGAMLRMAKACLTADMGLGKRYREGIKWMKRSAEIADAQYNSAPYELGVMHETGFGDDIFPDQTYAAQLFTKSAELGHIEAAYRLGDAYEHGKLNCPRDPALSIHFYTCAAQNDHGLAQMALCAWYLVGAEPVLEKDENEAYEWALRAARNDLTKAQYACGYFTEMGIGCRRDPLEARVWYVRAAEQGDERAKHRIAAIQAASEGVNPALAAQPPKQTRRLEKADKKAHVKESKDEDSDKSKQKRFVIF